MRRTSWAPVWGENVSCKFRVAWPVTFARLKRQEGDVSPAFFGLSIDINVVPWPPHTFSSTISLTMDTNDKSATKRTHSEASLPVEPLTVKQSKLDDTLRQIDPSLYGVDVKATSKDPKLVKELALSPGEELSTFSYEGLAGL